MPRDRFFIEGVHASGAHVALAPDDARKIATVLRMRDGDAITVVDSAGATFEANIAVAGTAVSAVLGAREERDLESAARIVVAQAIPKGAKMEFVIEKATELGVAAIVPLRSARVVGERTGENKRERWQRVAKTAAQQSGRTRVPAIAPEADWASLTATFGDYDRVYVPWELAPTAPLRDRFEDEARTARAILIVIGPEGGFAAGEVDAAIAAGAQPISLGKRILRTETAALVVVAALLYARGEL